MRLTLIALAAALAASVSPAAACGSFACADPALADDSYPAGETALSPSVQILVHERQGKGMSLAGFYNDPALALAAAEYAPPPAYVEAPDAGFGYRDEPHVIVSPYVRHGDRRRWARHERHGRVY